MGACIKPRMVIRTDVMKNNCDSRLTLHSSARH
jgi:hypothetical protein